MNRTGHNLSRSLCVSVVFVSVCVYLSHYLMMKCLRSTIIIIRTNSYNGHNRLSTDVAGHSVWTVRVYVYIAPLNDFLRLDWAHSHTLRRMSTQPIEGSHIIIRGDCCCCRAVGLCVRIHSLFCLFSLRFDFYALTGSSHIHSHFLYAIRFVCFVF